MVMGKNVLVVKRSIIADDALREHFGDDHVERVPERTAERLPGETVEAVAGEADVGLAVRDALASFPADEIVVAKPFVRQFVAPPFYLFYISVCPCGLHGADVRFGHPCAWGKDGRKAI